jgi:hypothetical protein
MTARGTRGRRYALPRLRWLGVQGDMLDGVPRSAFHALTGRDTALLGGLRRRLAGHAGWLAELDDMEERVSPKRGLYRCTGRMLSKRFRGAGLSGKGAVINCGRDKAGGAKSGIR